MTKTVAPYGTWDSPVTTDLITRGAVGLGQPAADGADIYWTEFRSWEAGRTAIVRRAPDGAAADVIPAPFNVRSRVHEYGGDAYCVADGVVWFVDFATQGLYRVAPGGPPERVFQADGVALGEPVWDAAHRRVLLISEDARDARREPVNRLSAVGPDGRLVHLAEGADFYAFPRPRPDGSALAWIEWRHPDMPWDASVLKRAAVDAAGRPTGAETVAGGPGVSAFQPEWSPAGRLTWVDDRDGWWRLYDEAGGDTPLTPTEGEFGLPLWQLGMHRYRFLPDGRMILAYAEGGVWRVGLVERGAPCRVLDLDLGDPGALAVAPDGSVLVLAHTPTRPVELVRLSPDLSARETIKSAMAAPLDPADVSVAEPVAFSGAGGRSTHAFHYPPRNARFEGPAGEKPPLIVKSHGGPTGQAGAGFALKTQYWTSRGFAVLDVNYGGSTGYGRSYRERLDGAWGVGDVEDVAAGARAMARQGLADPHRLVVTGGSAGGYTTLCALTFTDVFKAGCSAYGVGDLETLARDTHKFESRYLDRLVGPWPDAARLYRDRSPVDHVDRLNCPVIFLQGADDKVVPPNQAEDMVGALEVKGVPVAYLLFDGEGHGFRRADTVRRALEAELSFYAQVFGFVPAGDVEPVAVRNLNQGWDA